MELKFLDVVQSVFGVICELKSLREKCANTEFLLVRIFTEYLSIFSPNAGKYGPEKLRMRTLFT